MSAGCLACAADTCPAVGNRGTYTTHTRSPSPQSTRGQKDGLWPEGTTEAKGQSAGGTTLGVTVTKAGSLRKHRGGPWPSQVWEVVRKGFQEEVNPSWAKSGRTCWHEPGEVEGKVGTGGGNSRGQGRGPAGWGAGGQGMGVLLQCHLHVQDCSALCTCPRSPHREWQPWLGLGSPDQKRTQVASLGGSPGNLREAAGRRRQTTQCVVTQPLPGEARAQSHGDLRDRYRRPPGGFARDKDGGAPSATPLSILGEGRFWGHQLFTQRPALCPAEAAAPDKGSPHTQ